MGVPQGSVTVSSNFLLALICFSEPVLPANQPFIELFHTNIQFEMNFFFGKFRDEFVRTFGDAFLGKVVS